MFWLPGGLRPEADREVSGNLQKFTSGLGEAAGAAGGMLIGSENVYAVGLNGLDWPLKAHSERRGSASSNLPAWCRLVRAHGNRFSLTLQIRISVGPQS